MSTNDSDHSVRREMAALVAAIRWGVKRRVSTIQGVDVVSNCALRAHVASRVIAEELGASYSVVYGNLWFEDAVADDLRMVHAWNERETESGTREILDSSAADYPIYAASMGVPPPIPPSTEYVLCHADSLPTWLHLEADPAVETYFASFSTRFATIIEEATELARNHLR